MKPQPDDERELFPDLDAAGAMRAAFRSREPATFVRGTLDDTQRGYELREEIARGGMGVVVKAFDRGLERDVAIKVLRDELAHEPRHLQRFLDEARVTARLDHPGVVPVHEVGRDARRRAFFAMRLVRGRELREVIELSHAKREGWSQARCLSVVLRVCEAMAYAHDKSVLHRDLKPSNVMVGEFGEVYVMDWGLARVIGSADAHDLRLREQPSAPSGTGRAQGESPIVTMDGEILGTPCYMPPEQARGQMSELGPRSDVYSVGALLYHLLAGEMPYVPAGASVASRAVLARVIEGPPRPLHELRADLPAELVAICETAMARDPAQRYPSMLAMAEDLRAFLEVRVVRAYQTGAVAEFRKWVQRNQALAAASGAAVLALALGLVASLVLKAQSDRNAKLAKHNEGVAKQNEQLATARADDVLRLSALQELDDLTAEADALWPVAPELLPRYSAWMEHARELRADVPAHEAKLEELRARAIPRSEAEVAEAQAHHARYAELLGARRKLERFRRSFAAAEPVPREAPALDEDELARTWRELNDRAWPMIDPGRENEGDEARGLALALRAAALAKEPRDIASVHDTLAWACFANARWDEALAAERKAVEHAELEDVPRYRRYLADLEASVHASRGPDRATQQRAWIAELESRAAALDAATTARTEWTFADTQDKWWHNQLTKLLTGLTALFEPERGLASPSGASQEHGWSIGKRLELARTIEARSVSGPEAAKQWVEARASIADMNECPRYAGLALAPQLGLLPIGRDKDSGLWEFAHLESGEPAERGADGKLVLRAQTGIVLVLLPGGSYVMGAQKTDPSAPHYDPDAYDDEQPVHTETLSPFFLSKYEMTQGQWLALHGYNPSHYSPSYSETGWDGTQNGEWLLHPVEQVTWTTCVALLPHHGLALPTESRWEYGCRAGTDTVYWCGDTQESLQGVANLMDSFGKAHGNNSWTVYDQWLDDGETVHGAVGRYRANAFGLHDIHGNVFEWCADAHNTYPSNTRSGDVAGRPATEHRVLRGGSFGTLAVDARCATRQDVTPVAAGANLGVRPARDVAR